jgi:exosortase/archaeosortase family protein
MAALLLSFAVPVFAQTWTVEYSRVGDVSFITPVFPPGTYELVKTPDFIPVYLRRESIWDFVGMYGAPALGQPQAPLPESFPKIAFTGEYDFAIVRPVIATPELAILRSSFARQVGRYIGGPRLAAVVNPTLQRVTTWSVAKLLNAPYQDDRIYLRSAIMVVEEWCSGIMTMKSLLVLATILLVIGRVIGRISWPWALAVLVVTPLIAVDANIFRVYGIGIALEWYGVAGRVAIKEWAGWGALAFGMAQVVGLGLAWPWCRRKLAGLGK